MSIVRRCSRVWGALLGAAVLPLTGVGLAEAVSASAPADLDPVYLPILFDASGPSAVDPDGETVFTAIIDGMNAEGGLNGHPIEFEVIDTAGDVARASAAVADIAEREPVAVFLHSPSVEASIGEDLSALGVPIVGVGYNPGVWGGEIPGAMSCETDPGWCSLPNFFAVTTTFSAVVAEQLVAAQLAGATKVAMAHCAETDSCAAAVPLFEGVAGAIGLEVGSSIGVSTNAADYTGECITWIQEGVDFIQMGLSASGAIRIANDCLDQGYEGIFGASAGSVRAELLELPGVLAGGLTGFPWWGDEEPVVEYREIMEAGGADFRGSVNTATYASLRLLQTAIADHVAPDAALDGAAALAAMHSVQDESLDGLIVPVSFSEDNLDRHRNCFWPFIKDEEHNFENPLGGLTYQCFPPEEGASTSAAPGTTSAG